MRFEYAGFFSPARYDSDFLIPAGRFLTIFDLKASDQHRCTANFFAGVWLEEINFKPGDIRTRVSERHLHCDRLARHDECCIDSGVGKILIRTEHSLCRELLISVVES